MCFLAPTLSFAECAAPAPICDTYQQAKIVFLGEVIEVAAPKAAPHALRVLFRVTEGIKGVSGSHLTLAFARSSEEFHFVKGQQVLVYARQWRGYWFAGCTRTKEAIATDPEVAVVRGLSQGQSGGFVYGEIWSPTTEIRSMAGIRLKLRRDGTPLVVETVTDVFGRFQFPWLTAGRYSLIVIGGDRYWDAERSLDVKENSGCIAVQPFRLELRQP